MIYLLLLGMLLLPIVLLATVLIVLALPAGMLALVFAALPVRKVPLRYNLRSVQVRWLTALITAVAVTLVIALLVVMLAFVKGMDKMTENSGHPGNILILDDGATDEAFSNLNAGFNFQLFPSTIKDKLVKTDDGKFLASKEVYVIITHVMTDTGTGRTKRRFVQVRGLDDPRLAAQLHDIELADGDWFSPTGRPEVVLGDGIAKTFGRDVGKPALQAGDSVEIGPLTWKVAGVMKPSGSTFGSEIWVHDGIVQERFGRKNSCSSFVVRTADAKDADEVAEKITEEKTADRAFKAYTERAYYASLTATNDQFRYAIIFVAAVMAIGGVLGVMITMFAAVSQRVKDVGVLRLLGYTRWQILSSFLLESLLLSLLGGLAGCALGFLFNGWTVSSIVSSGQASKGIVLKLVVDFPIVGIGLGATLLMGAIGGFIPSVNAMRLKPLESLK